MTTTPGRPDTAALMADIEREVRERRRSGALPEGFERDLDRAFEAVAPPGATGQGFEAVLDRAERAAFVDPVGPVASRVPGVPLLRRVLRKLLAFYVEHVVRQVTAFGVTLVRAVRLLGDRVSALEAESPASDPRVRAAAAPVAVDLDVGPWLALVEGHLGSPAGRVLHADCGTGVLAAHLAARGVDVYGVDDRPDAAERADAAGVEVRSTDALGHLRALPEGVLGGLVLSGCVDRLPLGDLLELAALAAGALADGAPIVVLGAHPGAWAASRSPVSVDLAPGRPLHPETWAHLLGSGGFDGVRTSPGPVAALEEVGDAAVDANFRRLGAALLVPDAFAVTAVRAARR